MDNGSLGNGSAAANRRVEPHRRHRPVVVPRSLGRRPRVKNASLPASFLLPFGRRSSATTRNPGNGTTGKGVGTMS